MKNTIVLILTTLLAANSASAMIRTMKYRPLTEVKDKSICVYTKHERNRKKENQLHILNDKNPIVCKLNIKGRTGGEGSPVLEQSIVQYLEFEKLTRSCVTFDPPKGQKIAQFAGLSTECATAEAAVRVFPEYAAQLKKPKAKAKG